jgi:hypothetical protein
VQGVAAPGSGERVLQLAEALGAMALDATSNRFAKARVAVVGERGGTGAAQDHGLVLFAGGVGADGSMRRANAGASSDGCVDALRIGRL